MAHTETHDETVTGPQGELQLRVDRATGSRTPLLLLHSDAGRLEQWDEAVAALLESEPDRAIARLDCRGHGRSGPAADGDYGYAGRAADALAVADHLGWDRVVVIAHSGGNGGALWIAAHAAERMAALLMVDPPTDPNALPEEMRQGMLDGLAGPDSLAFLGDYYRSIAGSDPVVVDRVLADTRATTPESRLGVGQALMRWTPDPLDSYDGPVRVIGTDVTDGPAAIWSRRTELPHVVVHGVGHWVNIESPDVVAEELRRLLDSA